MLIDLSGLGLDYEYFLKPIYEEEVAGYKQFLRTVGSLLLRDSNLNLTEAERTFRLDTFVQDAFGVENKLAQIKGESDTTTNAHATQNRIMLKTLNDNSKGAVDWTGLFTYMFGASVTGNTYVVVLEQEYIQKVTDWIAGLPETNKTRMLNNYMIWRLAHRYVQDLSWDYMHANRELYFNLTGEKDFLGSWRYCFNKLNDDMSEALGALFVRDHFTEADRKMVEDIADSVKKALIESLDNSTHWMSPGTRLTAISKLEQSLIKLGYPDYMISEDKLNNIYANLDITGDYFSNLLSFNKFFKEDWTRRLTQPDNDRRAEWVYPVYSFVAEYFNPWKELIIPAGLMQFPIYDLNNPGFMNFGSMGTVVARQLVHAVDEIGSQYMLNGSHYGNWWSSETKANYASVKKCIIDAYVNETQGPYLLPGRGILMNFHININEYYPIALGESSSIKLALRSDERTDVLHRLRTGRAIRGTVLENLRVNNALAQVEEFQQAFNCAPNSKMVAERRCQLY
ncbi:hypothetical protein C0Q70_04958 [Pomacea canaliculata]|uniref:Endothelin-converting enzyme 1 n=1 Tax=Pomacea canaliculata TaxID=400727 RepID=A0A2T7PJV6_POMCA|nr:hypothetical protein C0Q70_04958 [Pomacea canaliculata]